MHHWLLLAGAIALAPDWAEPYLQRPTVKRTAPQPKRASGETPDNQRARCRPVALASLASSPGGPANIK